MESKEKNSRGFLKPQIMPVGRKKRKPGEVSVSVQASYFASFVRGIL